MLRWHFKPYVKHMPLTYAIGDANATPRSARAKNKVLRCSADASVAYFNKHRLVGLSGPLIFVPPVGFRGNLSLLEAFSGSNGRVPACKDARSIP